MNIVVTPVRGAAETRAFIRLPYDVYHNDPHWVPPLERERRMFLDRRRNPFFEFGTAELFLARLGGTPRGRVVGRIAAVVDPRYNAQHGPQYGLFGLFECVDDPEVAQALFAAAGGWLRDRGFTTMLGPLNFSTNDECGLLVEGFDRPPAIMMAHNPRYYVDLFANCGFTKIKDLWSWLGFATPDGEPPGRVARAAAAIRRREGVTVRPVDLRRLTEEIASIKSIYNSAWSDNWGSVPMTDREVDHFARQLKPILRPEIALIAELQGKPVGFALGLPDFNRALQAAGGRLTTWGLPIGLVRMLLASRQIDRGRLLALGIRPEYRRRGIEVLLYADLHRAGHRLGYREYEMSWTLEDNHEINKGIEAMGGVRIRTHRIYQRPLTGLRS